MYSPFITTLFFLFPIFLFLVKGSPLLIEAVYAMLISINLVLSLLFWSNPVQHSSIHRWDGFFAKLSYVIIPSYILFIKELDIYSKISFVVVLAFATMMFYFSNCFSKTWGCHDHQLCHSMFHLFTGIGGMFAFL
jgi:hypothetical protein